ncbi:hypothetical protein JQC92_22080 [Shewanella sp. 202IG2-18]|uniref:GNAT family N-acetyltransferase n=1 Tax=Parashewanella hymeniacidonis TaxID=2807618 RepID=UPI001961B827|nr:GNAT family N-acetyltransferase [Parashewanella hymeniacidonis]MBM7074665.1 hypothetical protein [Parashewanella hymeniacidonis]
MQSFEIREATAEDIMEIYGTMVVEQWNPGVFDQVTYSKSKSVHMFVGVMDGRVVSSCCACIYDTQFAFFGLYLVFDPKNRGKGYGLSTYQHRLRIMEQMGVKSIGCDGALEQTHNYAKNGFVDNYLNRRFSYFVTGSELINEHISIDKLGNKTLALFETKFVYEPRLEFISTWLDSDPTMKFASKYNEEKELLAVGIARQAQTGFRVGPIYANSLESAKEIIHALAAQLPQDAELLIDIPEANCHSDHFIKDLRLRNNDFECMRMYRGPVPAAALDQVYGVCTLEVG